MENTENCIFNLGKRNKEKFSTWFKRLETDPELAQECFVSTGFGNDEKAQNVDFDV
jgi:hypothetical protein